MLWTKIKKFDGGLVRTIGLTSVVIVPPLIIGISALNQHLHTGVPIPWSLVAIYFAGVVLLFCQVVIQVGMPWQIAQFSSRIDYVRFLIDNIEAREKNKLAIERLLAQSIDGTAAKTSLNEQAKIELSQLMKNSLEKSDVQLLSSEYVDDLFEDWNAIDRQSFAVRWVISILLWVALIAYLASLLFFGPRAVASAIF